MIVLSDYSIAPKPSTNPNLPKEKGKKEPAKKDSGNSKEKNEKK